MKLLLNFLFLTLSIHLSFAQNNDYFQQIINYDIDVELDDQTKQLEGFVDITYVNNAPDTLHEMFFHLWANAYQNNASAFAKQLLSNNDLTFEQHESRGGYSTIDFIINEEQVAYSFYENHQDIAKIELNEGLLPGDSVHINIPFQINIPYAFSRFGYVEDYFQMCQWYPKPAVYDQTGWHPMPYLEYGEFYSEFADYKVRLKLPKNYVVSATGTLQTATEKAFLEQKIQATNDFLSKNTYLAKSEFPESSQEKKTLVYEAKNVHDFAWFADKRFLVQKKSFELKNGETVTAWAYFIKNEARIWKKATTYIERSIQFYSDKIGFYPYQQASAVFSGYTNGADMEYPMVTIIGDASTEKSLDEVITHEVGHNWFYGVLASNERDFAWMDEGVNSYYEKQYMSTYYKRDKENIGFFSKLILGLNNEFLEELYMIAKMRTHTEMPVESPSEDFLEEDYFLYTYSKPAKLFKILEAYVGQQAFDNCMRSYFKEWKFKHPQPKDIQTHFEKFFNKKFDWLFVDYIQTTKQLDYALVNADFKDNGVEINIKNKGNIAAPFPIAFYKKDKVIKTEWIEGFIGEQKLSFADAGYDKVVIDPAYILLENNRQNNSIRLRGLLPKAERPNIRLMLGLENPNHSTIYVSPALGYNEYDNLMIGGAMYNTVFPPRNFEWYGAALFGTRSRNVIGVANASYYLYPESNWLKSIRLEMGLKRFSYDYNEQYEAHSNYTKFQPRISLKFNNSTKSKIKQFLTFRSVNVYYNYIRGIDLAERIYEREDSIYSIQELAYNFEKKSALQKHNFSILMQQGKDMFRLEAEYKWFKSYNKKKTPQYKGIHLRGFAGYQASESNPFRLAGNVYRTDYMLDEILMGRSETEGLFGRQNYEADGGFLSRQRVSSNNFMIALNAKFDFPGRIPLQVFTNIALTEDFVGESLHYELGLSVPIIRELLVIHCPIFNSESIKNNQDIIIVKGIGEQVSFLDKISFTLNINGLNPLEVARKQFF